MPYRNAKGNLIAQTHTSGEMMLQSHESFVFPNIRKNTWKCINWSHKSRFTQEPRYLPVCSKSTDPSEDRIGYSGQHQGRFNLRLVFSSQISGSSILWVRLTDIMSKNQISLCILCFPIQTNYRCIHLTSGHLCMHIVYPFIYFSWLDAILDQAWKSTLISRDII